MSTYRGLPFTIRNVLGFMMRAEDLALAGILAFDTTRRIGFTCGASGGWLAADGADRAAFIPTILAASGARP